jgi:hypothetical protein
MTNKQVHTILTYCIALVWIINGLFCKILNFVPRHKQIISEILGDDYAQIFTRLIGFSEVVMALWILSKFKHRLNAAIQIAIVGLMNILEFILVPELLLWGKLNSLFAFIFILVVYLNEFYLNKKIKNQI